MGFSRKEFIALLNSQNKLDYQRQGNDISFTLMGQKAFVTLGDEGVRRIAAARLPKLDVNFNFSEMGDVEQEQFMKLFLSRFHKGGG